MKGIEHQSGFWGGIFQVEETDNTLRSEHVGHLRSCQVTCVKKLSEGRMVGGEGREERRDRSVRLRWETISGFSVENQWWDKRTQNSLCILPAPATSSQTDHNLSISINEDGTSGPNPRIKWKTVSPYTDK